MQRFLYEWLRSGMAIDLLIPEDPKESGMLTFKIAYQESLYLKEGKQLPRRVWGNALTF